MSEEADDAALGEALQESEQVNVEAVMADMESRYVEIREEKEALEATHTESQALIKQLQERHQELQQSLTEKESLVGEAQRESLIQKKQMETVQAEAQLKQERMERMEAEADSLREEISRLSEKNKGLTDQVSEMETMSKLTESSAVPLQYEVNRTRKELDALSSHRQWLEKELNDRNTKMIALQQKHSSQILEIRQELDQAVAERDETTVSLSKIERSHQVLQKQLEQTSTELKDAKQEAATLVEASKTELIQERRLVELQKEQMDRLKTRYEDALKALESQRALAEEASAKTQEQLLAVREEVEESSQQVLKEQSEEYEKRLESLQTRLEDAERLRQEAEDGVLASPHRRLLGSDHPRLSTGEAEPMGLTEMQGKIHALEDALQTERKARVDLENFKVKVLADLAAEQPKMIRQRQECERAMAEEERCRSRLQDALAELNSFRQVNDEIVTAKAQLVKQNRELEQENHDLAKQVQTLLVSKAGGDTSNTNIPVNIIEIQSQNQKILQENRRLSNDLSDLQDQLRTDPLKLRCEEAEEERDALRENEKRQEVLVAGIVQQRDLYRALLAKHDSALVDETTTEIVVAQSERTKKLEELKITLETDLAKSQAGLTAATREKEIFEERTNRYEAHCNELTSSVDKLQTQLSSAKADVARSEADAKYHHDKCTRLEESLQLARDESKRLQEAKDQLQKVNGVQQDTVAKANATAMKCELELGESERKLRLAEVQVETAKKSERRLTEEVMQLRTEVARQGGVMESVQRIEANLSAKSDEQVNALKEETEKLSQTLTMERSKHSVELENLSGRVRELELDLKTAEAKKDDAMSGMLAAKEDAMRAMSEAKDFETKCARLEAEVRSIKKKFGQENADDADNSEVVLETKVATLTADLEATKAELETAKKRVEDYQKLAKSSEDALADLTKSTNEYKIAQEKELEALQQKVEEFKTESESKQEVIIELTGDLSNLRGEHEKVILELKGKISGLEEEAVSLRKDTESANERAGSMDAEIARFKSEATMAQNNYERELNLHSTARTALRQAREEADAEIRLRKTAEEQLESVRFEIQEQKKIWQDEKNTMETVMKELETTLAGSRSQNEILHSQLATLGDQVEKSQSERIAAATSEETATTVEGGELDAAHKTITELREIVRFMRSEQEMSQAQVDAARRTAEREKGAAAVTLRSLEEARSELKILRDSRAADDSSAKESSKEHTLATKLQAADDQLTLLRESNKLLREESDALKKSVAALQEDLSAVKTSVAPNEKKHRQLEVDKAALEAEKASLLREVEAWKGRVNSLVSKFHQIDPEDHKKALKRVEDLTKECESFKSQKGNAEKEATSAKALVSKLNKDLSRQKVMVDTQKKMIAKMQESSSSSSAKASADAVKERDLLKEKIKKLESSSASVKTELDGANQRNELLKTRLRQFQKMIVDLKKQKSELEQAVKSASAAPSTAPSVQASVSGKAKVAEAPSGAPERPEAEARKEEPKQATKAATTATKEVSSKGKTEKKSLPSVPPGGFRFGPGESSTATAKAPAKSKSAHVASSANEAVTTGTETKPPATESKLDSRDTAKPAAKAQSAEDLLRERLLQRKRKAQAGLNKAKTAKAIKTVPEESEKKASMEDVQPSPDTPREETKKEESTAAANMVSSLSASAPSFQPSVPALDQQRKRKAQASGDKAEPAKAKSKTISEEIEEKASKEEEEQPSQDTSEEQKSGEEEKERAQTEESTPSVPPSVETAPEQQASPVEAMAAAPIAKAEVEPSVPVAEASVEESSSQAGEESAPTKATPEATPASATDGGEQTASASAEAKAEGETTKEQPAKPSTFGSSPFGSGTAFGSGTGTFGTGAFGGGKSLSFGKSSSVESGTSSAGAPAASAGFGTKPSGESTFGGGSAFLNMKPPGSSTTPFTFGTSGNIKLPLPAKGAPLASASTFGAFGQGLSASGGNPFGQASMAQAQAKPLFGSSTSTKTPDPGDDSNQAEKDKLSQIEENEDDDAGDEEAEEGGEEEDEEDQDEEEADEDDEAGE